MAINAAEVERLAGRELCAALISRKMAGTVTRRPAEMKLDPASGMKFVDFCLVTFMSQLPHT